MKSLGETLKAATEFVELLDAGPDAARRVFRCERCNRDIGKNTWICDACLVVHRAELRDRALAHARATIPEKFRTASFHSLELQQWVKASKAAIRGAYNALKLPIPIVTIVGAPGSGKTTLACAMLREVIDQAGKLECDEATLARGRRARFYEAYDLSVARKQTRLGGGEPIDLADAKTASVLVVDEIGRDDRSTSDVAKILHDREAERLFTIVTTWMSQADIAAAYDGGIARRLFESATLIELGAAS